MNAMNEAISRISVVSVIKLSNPEPSGGLAKIKDMSVPFPQFAVLQGSKSIIGHVLTSKMPKSRLHLVM